jgi:hypothetical protein
MARAVARQCQMDPKVYLPLVEGFQAIGNGRPVGSLEESVMRFQVYVHLINHSRAVEYGIKSLSLYARFPAVSNDSLPSVESVADTIFRVVKENELFAEAIPLLNSSELLMDGSNRNDKNNIKETVLTASGKLLRRIRSSYGLYLSSKQLFAVSDETKSAELFNFVVRCFL